MLTEPTPLNGRNIVLGVTGSIAAYKSAYIASSLTQLGATVNVVMTEAATRFIGPTTFAGLTHQRVSTSLWDQGAASIDHVELGINADCIMVAPATANSIAKLALGITDDALTATILASRAPLVIAPAMDADMYASASTQANVDALLRAGATFVGPESGRLASGLSGAGRMADPDDIVDTVRSVMGSTLGDYAGRSVVVTAGGTREPLDPVRVITNRSSGKMGYEAAKAARDRGANVTLVTTPTALRHPAGMTVLQVETVEQMRDAVLPACKDADLLIMAAAISDFKPSAQSDTKIKKSETHGLTLELEPIRDWMPDAIGDQLIKVAFAAETGDAAAKAVEKVSRKGAAFTVANDISEAGSGFGVDTNRVDIVKSDGSVEALPLMTKYAVGNAILDRALPYLRSGE